MLLRPQPCCWPLILVLLVQTMLGLGLVGAVPATRAPGGRRRSTTTTPRPTPASTAPACASTTTVPSTATPALAAPPAGPPTVSLAATNSTWPKHFVGPPDLPGRPTPVGPPPGGGAGGNVKDNLIEEDGECLNVAAGDRTLPRWPRWPRFDTDALLPPFLPAISAPVGPTRRADNGPAVIKCNGWQACSADGSAWARPGGVAPARSARSARPCWL